MSFMKAGFLGSCVVIFACAAQSVTAHHSSVAEFDGTKLLTLPGKVTRIDWRNPHAFIYIDVTDDKGETSNWGVELSPPNILLRAGWTRNAVGDQLTITGYASKDGSKRVRARNVTLADGRSIVVGSAADATDVPKQN